jgi:hypothetical protein
MLEKQKESLHHLSGLPHGYNTGRLYYGCDFPQPFFIEEVYEHQRISNQIEMIKDKEVRVIDENGAMLASCVGKSRRKKNLACGP